MPKEIHSKAWIWCWNSLLQGQESELTFNLLGYLRLLFFFKSFLCWIGVCAPSRLRLSTLAVIPVYVFPYSFSLSWQSELYWSLLNSNGSVWDETLRGALSLSPRSNYKANGPALPMGFQFNGKLDSPEHHLKAVYRCFLDRLQAYCSCIVQGSILRYSILSVVVINWNLKSLFPLKCDSGGWHLHLLLLLLFCHLSPCVEAIGNKHCRHFQAVAILETNAADE